MVGCGVVVSEKRFGSRVGDGGKCGVGRVRGVRSRWM